MFTTEPSVRGLRPMFLNGHGIGYDKHRDNNEHLYTKISVGILANKDSNVEIFFPMEMKIGTKVPP